LQQARYWGLAKAHFLGIVTATEMNLTTLANLLFQGSPIRCTRAIHFVRLSPNPVTPRIIWPLISPFLTGC